MYGEVNVICEETAYDLTETSHHLPGETEYA
jgi:hypothetical protein